MNITALVLGAGGYAGMLLIRILAHHPRVGRIVVSNRTGAGQSLREVDPGLSNSALSQGKIEQTVVPLEEAFASEVDVVFSALPHLTSAQVCAPILGTTPLIDLSADFRFAVEENFRDAYDEPWPAPGFQDGKVYGLVEWYREQIRDAMIIANPGCYPTATLIPLLPIVAAGEVASSPIVVNALSGISGAGRKQKRDLLYAERTESVRAYNPGTLHRHSFEIREKLDEAANGGVTDLLFTPHLIPMKQGMAVTTVVECHNSERAIAALEERYAEEPFVHLTGTDPPETSHCRGTNEIRIGYRREGRRLILMSAIDNLWKGASGQAVQNMNVRFGLDQDSGLLREAEL